jgi:hypothetical protein
MSESQSVADRRIAGVRNRLAPVRVHERWAIRGIGLAAFVSGAAMPYKRRAGAERMSSEQTFTRQVCAVLLTEVAGFGPLKGGDEERMARAAEQMRLLVRETVARAGPST